MIAGTMIFESTYMRWRYLDTTRSIEVTVQDEDTGETAKLIMPARAFAASMALAIDPDGMDADTADPFGVGEAAQVDAQAVLYSMAEPYMVDTDWLRWIP